MRNGNAQSSSSFGVGVALPPAIPGGVKSKRPASRSIGDAPERATGEGDEALQVTIPAMRLATMELTITGTTPLICHNFDEKSIRQIEDTQQHKAKHKKAAKDPEDCFKRSLYPLPGKTGQYGVPAIWFKKAAVASAQFADGIRKGYAQGSFHVVGDILPVVGDKPTMRRDMVRVGGMTKVADVRYRGEFKRWSVKLTIKYNAAALTPEQIAHLFNIAGFANGVGEWRPQKGGQFGMFEVQS